MKEKKVKPKKKFSKLYFFTIIFIVLSFSSYLFYKYTILQEYSEQIKSITNEIDTAYQLNDSLIEQTEYKNSTEFVESLAREKLGMLKNNEIIFYDNN